MTFDKHGQLHAGTVGLFDCSYEHDETQHRLREEQELRKKSELKRSRKRAHGEAAGSVFPAPLRWLTKCFGWGKVVPKVDVRRVHEEATCHEHPQKPSTQRFDAMAGYDSSSSTYSVVTLEEDGEGETYPESAVDPEPSIFLEECGMVRVKSDNPQDFGWKIVPKSSIRRETLKKRKIA